MTDLDTQIAEVEHRIAGERVESRQALDDYKEHLREQATSFSSLAALVAVGYVAGRLLGRRGLRGGAGPGPANLLGLATSVLPAVIRARSRHRQRMAQAQDAGAPEAADLAVEDLRGGAT